MGRICLAGHETVPQSGCCESEFVGSTQMDACRPSRICIRRTPPALLQAARIIELARDSRRPDAHHGRKQDTGNRPLARPELVPPAVRRALVPAGHSLDDNRLAAPHPYSSKVMRRVMRCAAGMCPCRLHQRSMGDKADGSTLRLPSAWAC